MVEQSPRYSLIACDPLTGRTHQIRRHAALTGHPVLCDERYGSKRAINYLKNHGLFDRLGLHSHTLTLTMPEENETQTFISPCPSCFYDLMATDRVKE